MKWRGHTHWQYQKAYRDLRLYGCDLPAGVELVINSDVLDCAVDSYENRAARFSGWENRERRWKFITSGKRPLWIDGEWN